MMIAAWLWQAAAGENTMGGFTAAEWESLITKVIAAIVAGFLAWQNRQLKVQNEKLDAKIERHEEKSQDRLRSIESTVKGTGDGS